MLFQQRLTKVLRIPEPHTHITELGEKFIFFHDLLRGTEQMVSSPRTVSDLLYCISVSSEHEDRPGNHSQIPESDGVIPTSRGNDIFIFTKITA